MSWIKKLDEFIDRQGIKSSELCVIIDSLEKQIKECEEALKFYASEDNWELYQVEDDSDIGCCMCFVILQKDVEGMASYKGLSGGKRAREYFKKWGVE